MAASVELTAETAAGVASIVGKHGICTPFTVSMIASTAVVVAAVVACSALEHEAQSMAALAVVADAFVSIVASAALDGVSMAPLDGGDPSPSDCTIGGCSLGGRAMAVAASPGSVCLVVSAQRRSRRSIPMASGSQR